MTCSIPVQVAEDSLTIVVQTDVVIDSGGGGGTYQAKTVAPTESAQNVVPDSGYDALSRVTVDGIASDYVGSGITRRTSSDMTVNGATVYAPAGYYAAQAQKAVASTQHAAPDITISGNTVTASHTQGAGYCTGGTKTAEMVIATWQTGGSY